MRFSQQSHNGYFSLELILFICIVSLIFELTVPRVSQFFMATRHVLSGWEAANLCYFARMKAMAMDRDTSLALVSEGFCIFQDSAFLKDPATCVSLPSFIHSDINGSGKLGFKSIGNAQYAGTLTLQHESGIHYVTVQVGAGQINAR